MGAYFQLSSHGMDSSYQVLDAGILLVDRANRPAGQGVRDDACLLHCG